MADTQALDVTAALRAHKDKLASIDVEKDAVVLDPGHLAVFDSNPVDLKTLRYVFEDCRLWGVGQ